MKHRNGTKVDRIAVRLTSSEKEVLLSISDSLSEAVRILIARYKEDKK